jgi:hypothetical protein
MYFLRHNYKNTKIQTIIIVLWKIESVNLQKVQEWSEQVAERWTQKNLRDRQNIYKIVGYGKKIHEGIYTCLEYTPRTASEWMKSVAVKK